MPNYHRVRVDGGTYFFTVVTYQRRPILTSSFARAILRRAWDETKARFPFETIAICLLPDHIHCIWKLPDGDSDYSTRWNQIKGLFSKSYIKQVGIVGEIDPTRQKRRETIIWQRRFWEHTIESEEDMENHLDYIHFNPIKHGYVDKAIDWKWSSFRKYVNEGIYDSEWVGGDEGRIQGFKFE